MRLSQATTTTTTTATAATTTANDLDAEADNDHVGDDDQEEQQHSKSPPFMTKTTGPKQYNDQQQQQQRRQGSSTKISSRRSSWKKSITRRLSSIVSGLGMKKRRSSASTKNHVNEFSVPLTEEEMLSVLWTKHSLAYKRKTDIYYAVNLKINILSKDDSAAFRSLDENDEIPYVSFDNDSILKSRLLYPPICLGKASGSRRVSHPNSKFKLCGSTRTDLLQCIQILSICNRRLHVTMNTCDYPNDAGLEEFMHTINKRQLLESFTIQQSCSIKGSDPQQSLLIPIFQNYLKINRNLTNLNLKLWEGSKCLIDSYETANTIKQALVECKTLHKLQLDYHPQNRGANYIESYFQTVTEGIASNTSIEILTLTLYNNNRLVELLVGHSSMKKLHIRGPYKRMSSVENGGTNALIDMHLMPYEKLITSRLCKLEILKLSGQGLLSCFVDKLLSIELWADHPIKVLDVSENAIQNLQFPNYTTANNPHPWKLIKAKSNPISTEYYTIGMFQKTTLNTAIHCEELLPLCKKYPDLTIDWIDDDESSENNDDINEATTKKQTSIIEKLLRINISSNVDYTYNQCILDYHFMKNNEGIEKTLSKIPLLGPILFERIMEIFFLPQFCFYNNQDDDDVKTNNRAQARQANLIYQLWVKPYLPHVLLQLNESTMQQETTTKSNLPSLSGNEDIETPPPLQSQASSLLLLDGLPGHSDNSNNLKMNSVVNSSGGNDFEDYDDHHDNQQRQPLFAIVQLKMKATTTTTTTTTVTPTRIRNFGGDDHGDGYDSQFFVFQVICHYDKLIKEYTKHNGTHLTAASDASGGDDIPRMEAMANKKRSITTGSSNNNKIQHPDCKLEMVESILETERIFSNFHNSEYSSQALLKNVFGTENVFKISKHILEEGTIIELL